MLSSDVHLVDRGEQIGLADRGEVVVARKEQVALCEEVVDQ